MIDLRVEEVLKGFTFFDFLYFLFLLPLLLLLF